MSHRPDRRSSSERQDAPEPSLKATTSRQRPGPRDRVGAALENWRDYFLVGLPPARPRVIGPEEPLDAPIVFVITSVIRPTRPDIAYRWPRSMFDPAERLLQTIGTIESIRTRVPGAAIVLIEASPVADDEWKELAARVERPLRLDHDPRAARLRDGLSRAAGEAYMLLSAQQLLGASSYELAIKISGRYRLSEAFSLERLPRDRLAVTRLRGESGGHPARPPHRIASRRLYANVHSCRMYSVPQRLREIWEHQLRRAIRSGLRGHPLEVTLVRGLPEATYASLDWIGLAGRIAPTGTPVDE